MRAPASVPRLSRVKRIETTESDSPFRRGRDERPLRAVFDWPSIRVDETVEMLAGFAQHESVDAIEIDGPGGLPALVFGPVNEAADHVPLCVKTATGRRQFGISSPWQYVQFARDFEKEGLGRSADEMERELLVARAAHEWGADALITDSAFLQQFAPRGLVSDANPMSPEAGLALTGLFLRSREDFTILHGDGSSWSLNRQGFDWALARAMLPAGWRFFSACLASGGEDLEGPVPFLGQAVIERYAQALRARERVVINAQRGAGFGPADEQLFYLDHAVLALGGSFDALARVAHLTYGLRGNRKEAKWRFPRWLSALNDIEPQLAALMGEQEPARDVLQVIASLRNTIHGEALRGVRYSDGGSQVNAEHLVQIPHDDARELMEAIARREGPERWGVREVDPIGMLFEADRLIDVLMGEAADALNQLMAQTDVLRLPNVDPAAVKDRPTKDRKGTTEFDSPAQHTLRCLAGL